MLRINPLKAVRPGDGLAQSVASVPYDVINRDEAVALADGNPHSFLHVIRSEIDLPEGTNPYDDAVYAKAKENLERLMAEGSLIQDGDPALYLYRQIMGDHEQIGLVCCCHVDDYENELIKKHEKTRPIKEDDRTRHVLTMNANAGPVFLTYRKSGEVDSQVNQTTQSTDPIYDFTSPDGVKHTVWRVEDNEAMISAFGTVPCAYVADGHHRSASAWRAGKERRAANSSHDGNEEYNWFLCVLFPDEQLSILAYNRVVADLNGLTTDQALEQLERVGKVVETKNPVPTQPGTFCLYFGGGTWYELTIDPNSINCDQPIESLDVALLHDRILGPIFAVGDPRTDDRIDFVGGIRGTEALEKRVDEGKWACAVSMFPTSIAQLLAVSDAGMVMPPKSTWFEPKLRSGLIVHLLD